jgi:hypothetical protein
MSWYSGVYNALIIAGLVAFIIGMFSSGKISVDAFIAGYSTLALGVMLLLMTVLNGITKQTATSVQSQNVFMRMFQPIFSFFSIIIPFVLPLGVIVLSLYMLIKYRKPIINNRVSAGYYSFSMINIILILVQMYLFYKNTSTPEFEKTGKISSVQGNMITLLGIITTISAINVYIILKYFRTDGFTMNEYAMNTQ